MQTTADLTKESISQAQPAVMAKSKVGRLNYLDTLRVILICLVIALHTAITYGAAGDWTFRDPVTDEVTGTLLTLVTGLVQAFSLGLYFFIAGYFTPASYDRKGIRRFWIDRLLRLGIPLVLYTWVLNRIPVYFDAVASHGETRPFGQFFLQTFLTSPDEGPTWFIFALLMFSVGYTLWRLAARFIPAEGMARASQLKTPGKKEILGFGVVVGVLMFIVGLKSPVNNSWEVFGIFGMMIIFFVQYILFFIAGIFAKRNDWLNRWDGKDLRFWSWLTLGLTVMMPVVFGVVMATGGALENLLGGLYWESAAFMLWVGLFSVSISMMLMVWLRDQKKPQGRMLAFAGPNSYGVYLIHPLILVPISVGMSLLPIPPALKFMIVLPVVLMLCFLAADGVRRIPGENDFIKEA